MPAPLTRMLRALPRGLALALCLALLGQPAAAQKLRDKDKPANDPVQCPWCYGDPELMEASGIVSHGPFEFGKNDTAAIDEFFPTLTIRWTETEHFELGFAVSGSYKIEAAERDKIRAELESLAEVLPEIKPKARTLDPWLRMHLFARRFEDMYATFLGDYLELEQSVFPDGVQPWMQNTKYWARGRTWARRASTRSWSCPARAPTRSSCASTSACA